MRNILLLLSLCLLLFFVLDFGKEIRYAGFDDLVAGSETLNLFTNGEFEIEIGIARGKGNYKISGDTILLKYNKPTPLPEKFLMYSDRFEAIEYERRIGMKRIK